MGASWFPSDVRKIYGSIPNSFKNNPGPYSEPLFGGGVLLDRTNSIDVFTYVSW
jgi:hypothetical protein